jgi:putative oxidoreductase
MTVTMDIALLIFRVVIGLTLAGHGAQKLFGWFGGSGPVRLRQVLEKQGFKPVWFWVSLAIIGELGGGLSFALGFLTPLGAAGIFGAMVMAARTHWKTGISRLISNRSNLCALRIASSTSAGAPPRAKMKPR